jgi:hypothetical protein
MSATFYYFPLVQFFGFWVKLFEEKLGTRNRATSTRECDFGAQLAVTKLLTTIATYGKFGSLS